MGAEQSDLAHQVALITGGAGAIGRAIGEGLVKVGAKVVLVDINELRLEQFEQELVAKYGSGFILPVVADVSDSQQVKRAFELTLKEFGRLDILVNNAAVTQIKPVDALSDEDIDIIIDTNLKGYVKCARASNKSLYCASKGGELALARALALELGVFGIRVNTICPDAVLEGSSLWEDDNYRLGTAKRYNIPEEEIPDYYRNRCALKTNIQPEDVVNAALFLVSNQAAKITGAIITVDGGEGGTGAGPPL